MAGRKVDRWLTSPGVSCMMVCIGHRKEKRRQTKQKQYFVASEHAHGAAPQRGGGEWAAQRFRRAAQTACFIQTD